MGTYPTLSTEPTITIDNPTRNPHASRVPSDSVAQCLIEQLEDDDVFGLQAPAGACKWSLDAIRRYFDTDGEVVPSASIKHTQVSDVPAKGTAVDAVAVAKTTVQDAEPVAAEDVDREAHVVPQTTAGVSEQHSAAARVLAVQRGNTARAEARLAAVRAENVHQAKGLADALATAAGAAEMSVEDQVALEQAAAVVTVSLLEEVAAVEEDAAVDEAVVDEAVVDEVAVEEAPAVDGDVIVVQEAAGGVKQGIESAANMARTTSTEKCQASRDASNVEVSIKAQQLADLKAAQEMERRERDAIRMETVKYLALEKAEQQAEQASREQRKLKELDWEAERKAEYARDAKIKGLTPLQARIAEKAAIEREAEERWVREREAALRYEEVAAKKFMALMSEAANAFDDDDYDDLEMFI